jgi:hypothetical protein
MSDPRYPIGKYSFPGAVTPDHRKEWMAEIAATPERLRDAVMGLNDQQLDTPYREGGWTLRQVAHHLPDSHVNSYMRYRLALTEQNPTIRTYQEDKWAELTDAKRAPVDLSLTLLDAVHRRWLILLASMSESDFQRTLYHPEHQKTLTLDWMTGMYAWHGRHHVAHITSTRERMGW